MAQLETGGAPVDVGAQPPAPGGAPMAVPPSQQSSGSSAPAPAAAGPRRQQGPPPPLIGDEAFLAGPARGGESASGNPLNQTGSKVPPPPDAQAWLPWLVESANMPDASPGLKSLVQLLTYHLS